MAYGTIELNVRDGVAELTLARPQAANAINLELARDLMDATLECEENKEVRAASSPVRVPCSAAAAT